MSNETTPLRLFYALWPDDAVRTELMRMQAPIRGRWTAYANLHLTLAFLGQQPASLVPPLKDILFGLSETALSLNLDRAGYFKRKRIAWVGMHETPEALSALYRELGQALRQQGIAFDDKPDFRPHITLARDAAPPPDLPFEPIAWQVERIVLVESVTHPEGVLYRALASRDLARE